MTDLHSSEFYKLLPPNFKTDTTKALSAALDRQWRDLAEHIKKTLIYADISRLDEPICDFLALSFDIRAYDFSFPLDTKRALIRIGLGTHSKKGTSQAVKEVLETVFAGEVTVREWFSYSGRPHCFRLSIDGDNNNFSEHYDEVLKPVAYHKNLRSYLDGIDVTRRKQTPLFVGTVHTITAEVSAPPLSAIGSRRTASIKAGLARVEYVQLVARPFDGIIRREQSSRVVMGCGRTEFTEIKIPAYRRDVGI